MGHPLGTAEILAVHCAGACEWVAWRYRDRSSCGKDCETDSCCEGCGTVVIPHPLRLINCMHSYDENTCSDAETESSGSSSEDDEPFSEIGELDAAEVIHC